MTLEIGIPPEVVEQLKEWRKSNIAAKLARKFLTPPFLNNLPALPHRTSSIASLLHRVVRYPTTTSFIKSLQTANLALPPLDSIRAQLPASLQSYLPSGANRLTDSSASSSLLSLLPAPAAAYLQRLLSPTNSTELAFSSVLGLVLAAVLCLPLMASWRNYFGGRYSPFTTAAPLGGVPPRVTEDDYHYLGPEDIVDPPPSHRHGSGHHPDDDASQPDVLILKHRGTPHPLHFPAYAISEGILRVGELRRYAAEKTGTSDPRRIKLLYKGRVLKDDAVACCEEGLKQNSELMCVVSETPARGLPSSEDSESATEEDFHKARQSRRAQSSADGAGIPPAGVRVNVDGTIIEDPQAPPRGAKRTGHRSDKRPPKETKDGFLSATSTSSAAAAPSATPTPSASPKPQVPKTPHDKLDDLTDVLRGKWEPLVRQYIAAPPKDSKTRQTEYTRLSESILAHVLLKLDDITTDGDPDLRSRRKAMIVETQNVLSDLDAVGKGKSF